MDGNITLREMTKDDLNFVISIRNLESTRKYLENKALFTYEDSLLWFINNKPFWFIIYFGKHRIGYFRTLKAQEFIYVGLDLAEEYRGKKLSYPVFQKCLSYLRELGHQKFCLKVFEENEVAVRLYKKLGFKLVSSELVESKNYLYMELV